MMPIVFATSVVRTGGATRTTSLAVRRSVENAAAAIAFAVAGISSCRPGADGLITILPVAVTWNLASRGLRETVAERRSMYSSARRPPIETIARPPAGRSSRGAIRQRGTRQRVSPYTRRIGAERAVRACIAAPARSAPLTPGSVVASGSATGAPRSKLARARTTAAAAAGRSSFRPDRPSTTLTVRPVRTILASTPSRSIERAI